MKISIPFIALGVAFHSISFASADCYVSIGLEYNGKFDPNDKFQISYNNNVSGMKRSGYLTDGSSISINCGDFVNTAKTCELTVESDNRGDLVQLKLASCKFSTNIPQVLP